MMFSGPRGTEMTGGTPSAAGLSAGDSGFEAWRGQIQAICGCYNPELIETGTFQGWARAREIAGFGVLDVACNVERIERGSIDTRRDDAEYFYMIMQLAGEATMIQNDRACELAQGEVALIDSTRPSSFRYGGRASHQISIHLPRRECVSYIGFQPEGGMKAACASGIGRMLFALFAAGDDAAPVPATPFQTLLVYDLLGAAFGPARKLPVHQSLNAEIIFNRVCGLIRHRSHDPALCIATIAQAAGISVRYVQKLFTDRGTCFTAFLETIRLDRASLLLRRRRVLGARSPICDIAFACGFVSGPHFSRTFRDHFGHSPRDHGAG